MRCPPTHPPASLQLDPTLICVSIAAYDRLSPAMAYSCEIADMVEVACHSYAEHTAQLLLPDTDKPLHHMYTKGYAS